MKRIITPLACVIIAASVSAQNPPQQQQPPKPPSIEERLKHVNENLSKQITISAEKKKQIEAAYKDFFSKMDELRKKNEGNQPPPPPPPPPPPGKKEEVDKLVKERDDKIAKVLSADEYIKYKEIEKTMRPPMPPQHNKDGKNQPPPPPKNNQ
ncbi:MAG: hypothetical protein C0459_01485 [Chitinophaga sp.]|jgi:hypothetical protein|nr:hypothetical protein [Chitinophaga sp.]